MGRGRLTRPEIPLAAVKKLAAAVQASSHSSGELLEPFGLSEGGLDGFESRLELSLYLQIFARAENLTGAASLGRELGRQAVLSSFDLYGQVILYAADLREALDRAARFYRLWSSAGEWQIEDVGNRTVIRYHVPGYYPEEARPDVEFTMAAVLASLRTASPNPILGLRLVWPHEPPDPSGDEEFFGTVPGVGTGHAELELDRSDLALALNTSRSPLRAAVEAFAEQEMSRLDPGKGVTSQVREAMGRCERTGQWDVASLARDLHVSARTLQRSLQAEGTTFQAELDRHRRLRTKELLLRPQTSLSEIAFALGFSEVSALVRAFKKWEGVTPGAYRTGQGLRN